MKKMCERRIRFVAELRKASVSKRNILNLEA